MPLSLGQLVQQLTDSGLLSGDEVQALLQSQPEPKRPATAEDLARLLVGQRRLTVFQAQQALAGKSQSLVLGNYVLLDKVGQGGMGLVFKAEHRRMRRIVALKVLPPNLVKDKLSVERFHREVQAAARLLHPNIVAAYDADESRGTHFLVMEYVDGEDLSSLVKSQGPLPVAKAVDCVLQAGRGLSFAHAHGVIHRDIKPANLLLDRAGVVKVLDMGLARIEEDGADAQRSELTTTGTVMGTVDYMSPEQALNTKHANQRSDQYSLGVTLFYLLAGRPPYGGESVMEKLLAHRERPVPSLRAVNPETSASLDAIFQRMLAKRPEDRYPGMTECLADLERVQAGGDVRSPLSVVGPPPDQQFESFLMGLSGTQPQTLAATRLDSQVSGDRSLAATIVTSSISDTDLTGQTRFTAPPAGHSSSSIRGTRRARGWWEQPLVWAGGAGLLAVLAIGALLLSGGGDDAAPAVPAATAPRSTATATRPNAATRSAESEEQVLEWIFANDGQAWIGPSGGYTEVTSVAQWKELREPITSILLSKHSRAVDDDIRRLEVFPDLQALTLQDCMISDQGVSKLGAFRKLLSLNLAGTRITDEGLSQIDHLTQLSMLNIADTGVRGPGLRRLLRLSNLSYLDLSHLKVDDAALETLTGLPNLQELRLIGCSQITDACGATLARLPITTLFIDSTTFGDEGLAALAQAPKLKVLAISYARVTGAGLVAFAERHPLDAINCHGMTFTMEEGERLRAAWPEANIQASYPLPAVRSDLLARIVLSRDIVSGDWRKAPALLTPQHEDGVTHLLKLPHESLPTNYTLTLLVDRLAEQPRGGLGVVLTIGERRGLLLMDDPPGAPWRIERLSAPTYSQIIAAKDGLTTRIDPPPARYLQITVQPMSSGWVRINGYLNGAGVWSGDIDPAELTLPDGIALPPETKLAIASRDEFGIHQISLVPAQPITELQITAPLVTRHYPDAAPAPLTPAELLTSDDWIWSAPENLGPRVNDGWHQHVPRLSHDGLELMHQDTGPLHTVAAQMRDSADAAWRPFHTIQHPDGRPTYHPYLSRDGLTLLTSISEVPGDHSSNQLMQAERNSRSDPWTNWRPVLRADQTGSWFDGHALLSDDSLTLMFTSHRPGGLGNADIWFCQRADVAAPWSDPVNAGPEVNTPHLDAPCWLSPDGCMLLLTSNREGGHGAMDLWFAMRATPDAPWSTPANMGPIINTPRDEWSAELLTDGRTLLFDSDGHPGFGGSDLWLTRRVPVGEAGTPPK